MSEKIKELIDRATWWSGRVEDDYEFDKELYARLIVRDILGCYDAIDNGNKVEGIDEFVKAIVKRYGMDNHG